MPQKLIRLTCESNDGIFNSKFDEDIHIKKDSEIGAVCIVHTGG